MKGENSMQADAYQIAGDHYRSEIQPWNAMRSWMSEDEFRGFLIGNSIKYLARAGKKDNNTLKSDILKARHYLDKLLDTIDE
jgi:hypothetical protein